MKTEVNRNSQIWLSAPNSVTEFWLIPHCTQLLVWLEIVDVIRNAFMTSLIQCENVGKGSISLKASRAPALQLAHQTKSETSCELAENENQNILMRELLRI